MVDISGLLSRLKPNMNELLKIGVSAGALHYVNKVNEFANQIPIINMVPENWRGLALGWLIYKWGDMLHPLVSTFGAMVTVVNAEKLMAPYLPGSESVVKQPSGGERKLNIEDYAKMYIGGGK